MPVTAPPSCAPTPESSGRIRPSALRTSQTTSTAPTSTPRSGSRTTCRMWSSRAESAATYAVAGSELRLTIPPEQGLWCPGDHDAAQGLGHPVRRVLGSGRQHDRPAAVPRRRGGARVPAGPVGLDAALRAAEVRARMELSPRSMAAVWMVGLEDEPDALRRDLHLRGLRRRPAGRHRVGRACIRSAIRRSPRSGPRRAGRIDVAEFHVYAADWRPGGWTSSSTASTSSPSTRRRTTRCR